MPNKRLLKVYTIISSIDIDNDIHYSYMHQKEKVLEKGLNIPFGFKSINFILKKSKIFNHYGWVCRVVNKGHVNNFLFGKKPSFQ